MPECYITKRGYQLEYDKPYIGGGVIRMIIFPLHAFWMTPISL